MPIAVGLRKRDNCNFSCDVGGLERNICDLLNIIMCVLKRKDVQNDINILAICPFIVKCKLCVLMLADFLVYPFLLKLWPFHVSTLILWNTRTILLRSTCYIFVKQTIAIYEWRVILKGLRKDKVNRQRKMDLQEFFEKFYSKVLYKRLYYYYNE